MQLDRGFVSARCGQREAREDISEIELELSGTTDVEALRRTAETLGSRIELIPSDISKARRGYALLAAVGGA